MSKKAKAKTGRPIERDARAASLEKVVSLARRYPKATELLEVALEVGILAAQALRQIAIGVREGTKEVADRNAVRAVRSKSRERRVT